MSVTNVERHGKLALYLTRQRWKGDPGETVLKCRPDFLGALSGEKFIACTTVKYTPGISRGFV